MQKLSVIVLLLLLTVFSYGQKTKKKQVDIFDDTPLATLAVIHKIGYTSLDEIGCKTDGSVDNSKILNDYLNKNGNTQVNLFVPLGVYHFNNTITIINRTVNILGAGSPMSNEKSSTLEFPPGVAGISISRNKQSGMGEPIIENLMIRATGKKEGDKVSTGIRAWQRCIIRNCFVYNFGYRGIEVWGDINPYKNDANVTKILYNRVASCGDDGIFVVGADSNACLFLKNNVVDCGGYGCNDNSFLGNLWYGNDTNNNKKGGFHAINPTNQSTYVGNYEEFNQPKSTFAAPVKIQGGNLRQ